MRYCTVCLFFCLVRIEFKNSHKRLLRHFNRTELTHTLFTFFLLFEELFLSGDIAALALGKYVLAHSLDGFTGDDLAAYARLNRNLKELTRDFLL